MDSVPKRQLALAFALLFQAALAASASAPDDSLNSLREGNRRFSRGAATHPRADAPTRAALASAQTPKAIILTCSDSRVPPELVFDQGLGDLFTVRVAGNIASPSTVASVEYAVHRLSVPLIVVMGHESCGAVKEALKSKDGESSGSNDLDQLLSQIRGNFAQAGVARKRAHSEDEKALRSFVIANARAEAESLLHRSKIVRDAVDKGELTVVPAYYDLHSGKVAFHSPVASGAVDTPYITTSEEYVLHMNAHRARLVERARRFIKDPLFVEFMKLHDLSKTDNSPEFRREFKLDRIVGTVAKNLMKYYGKSIWILPNDNPTKLEANKLIAAINAADHRIALKFFKSHRGFLEHGKLTAKARRYLRWEKVLDHVDSRIDPIRRQELGIVDGETVETLFKSRSLADRELARRVAASYESVNDPNACVARGVADRLAY